MAEFSQLPGVLNFTLVPGDQVRLTCDFDVNLTGYTITNSIYAKSTVASSGGVGGVNAIGSTVTSFDANVVSAPDGTVFLDLPEEKSSLLSPGVGYRWYLRWSDSAGITRTVLSGDVTAVSP